MRSDKQLREDARQRLTDLLSGKDATLHFVKMAGWATERGTFKRLYTIVWVPDNQESGKPRSAWSLGGLIATAFDFEFKVDGKGIAYAGINAQPESVGQMLKEVLGVEVHTFEV